jgi:hypothetical protein
MVKCFREHRVVLVLLAHLALEVIPVNLAPKVPRENLLLQGPETEAKRENLV